MPGASGRRANGHTLPHEHSQNGSNGAEAVSEDHELTRAMAELARIEVAYDRALRRGCTADSAAEIAAAFDEADRLQRRMLTTLRPVRALKRKNLGDARPEVATPRDAAVSNGSRGARDRDARPHAETIANA